MQKLDQPVVGTIGKLAKVAPDQTVALLSDISKHGMKSGEVMEFDLIISLAKFRVVVSLLIPRLIKNTQESRAYMQPVTISALAMLAEYSELWPSMIDVANTRSKPIFVTRLRLSSFHTLDCLHSTNMTATKSSLPLFPHLPNLLTTVS